ncbi:TM129-like protein [Mya arenaria]|uniref:TM129-like protein n=1 Tax=Mya arenaria TaxID=6604 RepID=A0ABY7FP33_MYAAR|nr:TM129-like protein [Mya arenaria]
MLETKALLLFTFMYFFFSALLVAPPTEFISAGLTIQNVLSRYLGSEQIGFVYFHIKRTSATLLHCPGSVCPSAATLHTLVGTFLVPAACLVVLYWSQNKWDNHPIARQLDNLKEPESNWRAVASSVNVEFRRIDKFTSGPPTGRRIIVTDSWVIKTSTYFVHVAHQSDIHLSLSATEEHNISYENMTLNALDYKDLKEKLQSPVRNARNIVIRQTLSEQFLHAFAEQISLNPEVDTCIGCMQKQSDINLYKRCESPEPGQPVPEGSGEPCVQCYCRPMWCLECMGKWFASRQDQQRPDTWLGSKSPCPTCRAVFCILDVCKIEW